MAKVKYNDILFDSDLEVDYYKELMDKLKKGEVKTFSYHPHVPIKVNIKSTYTPDFIVFYKDTIEIIETKGYNPYSKLRDDMIHNFMLGLPEDRLKDYVKSNFPKRDDIDNFHVVYKKIKHLKSYGFVDWDFKNPNSQINQARNKITGLKQDVKGYKTFEKDTLRYFKLTMSGKKLTKDQQLFTARYLNEVINRLNAKESD